MIQRPHKKRPFRGFNSKRSRNQKFPQTSNKNHKSKDPYCQVLSHRLWLFKVEWPYLAAGFFENGVFHKHPVPVNGFQLGMCSVIIEIVMDLIGRDRVADECSVTRELIKLGWSFHDAYRETAQIADSFDSDIDLVMITEIIKRNGQMEELMQAFRASLIKCENDIYAPCEICEISLKQISALLRRFRND